MPHEAKIASHGRVRRRVERACHVFYAVAATLLGGIVVLALAFVALSAVLEKLVYFGLKRDLLGILVTSLITFVGYRKRRQITRLLKSALTNLIKISFFIFAAFFYLSAALSAVSFLMSVGDGLQSFLTAPLGLKPDHVDSGFGSLFPYLLGCVAVTGVFCWLIGKVKQQVMTTAHRLR